jgi:hypothetical protein
MSPMILKQGEKVHIIHRRLFGKDQHRHFIGQVDAYEDGIARVTGNVYTVDPVKLSFMRRTETRTRLVAIGSGDVLVNIIPARVNLEKIQYRQERKAVRVTDGSDWYLDLSEYSWM